MKQTYILSWIFQYPAKSVSNMGIESYCISKVTPIYKYPSNYNAVKCIGYLQEPLKNDVPA